MSVTHTQEADVRALLAAARPEIERQASAVRGREDKALLVASTDSLMFADDDTDSQTRQMFAMARAECGGGPLVAPFPLDLLCRFADAVVDDNGATSARLRKPVGKAGVRIVVHTKDTFAIMEADAFEKATFADDDAIERNGQYYLSVRGALKMILRTEASEIESPAQWARMQAFHRHVAALQVAESIKARPRSLDEILDSVAAPIKERCRHNPAAMGDELDAMLTRIAGTSS